MLVKDILRELDLGNSVAEHDRALERYFVETSTFRSLIRDEADVIAGDKGTGKTALFRILKARYPAIPEMETVEVVAGFNPTGNPVFQRLAEGDPMEEGEYTTLWKAYVLSLVGNWVLHLYEDAFTESMFELDELLKRIGLRSVDDSPKTIFSQLVNLFRRIMDPSAVEATVTVSPNGIPIVTSRIELGSGAQPLVEEVPHDQSLGLLQQVLDDIDLTIWLVMDRLDEAFQGFPRAEIPALRALLRTYLDLSEFSRIRMKLFVRKDLFRRIIGTGFVNLTHVNARKIEIVWDDDDLRDLLVRRIRDSAKLMKHLSLNDESSGDDVFGSVFPGQVDAGKRKPTTWVWILSRIRDGNGVKPPRNLIDLVQKSQEEQLRREERVKNEYKGQPLIGSDELKRGLSRLSKERVEDTLIAEAGEHASLIERFRDGKAEHNTESLALVLNMSASNQAEALRVLIELGFLEQVGANYKVPMLYRDGLGITQGKAFG